MNQSFSYWEQTSFLSAYDVLIVGSGIVGLSAALHLKIKKPYLKVGVLEAGFLPSGGSTKNAGFACFGSISEILDELKTTPEDELLQVIEMRWKGLECLRKNLGDVAIDFQQLGGYEVFRTDERESSESCINQINYFNKLLQPIVRRPDIYSVSNEKIAEFGLAEVSTLIENRCEGQIDTGKMMRALIAKIQQLGVIIFNNCCLEQIEQNTSNLTLITSQGGFSTQKVILATNAFTSKLYPELNVTPGRGQILMTEPVSNLRIKGTFHYDKGYYYFRNINSRILLGGGRHLDFNAEETTTLGITGTVQSGLEKLLYEVILPDQKSKIEHRWSGIMGFGDTLKPIIEEIEPNVFCAVRCNGMGVAMGSLVGQEVAELAFP